MMLNLNEISIVPYIVFSILILISISVSMFIKPHLSCRNKTFFLLIYLFFCLWIIHIGNSDTLLLEEDITALEQQQGFLEYIEIKKGRHGGYFLLSQDGKKQQHFSFILCSHLNMNLYLHKNISVWHKNSYVYQVVADDEIVASVEETNRNICLANTFNLLFCLTVFSTMLIPYYLILRLFNEISNRR